MDVHPASSEDRMTWRRFRLLAAVSIAGIACVVLVLWVLRLPMPTSPAAPVMTPCNVMEAIRHGRDTAAVLRYVRGGGCCASCRDEANPWNGVYPLHVAAAYGRDTIVEAILNAGGNPNQLDHSDGVKGTPIIWATTALTGFSGDEAGARRSVEMLISAGADLDARDGLVHRTAMHHLARNGSPADVRAMEFLASVGADINSITPDGQTPLHVAAATPHDSSVEAVRWLLDNGADASIRDARGNTPVDLAIRAGNLRIITHLKSRDSNMAVPQ